VGKVDRKRKHIFLRRVNTSFLECNRGGRKGMAQEKHCQFSDKTETPENFENTVKAWAWPCCHTYGTFSHHFHSCVKR